MPNQRRKFAIRVLLAGMVVPVQIGGSILLTESSTPIASAQDTKPQEVKPRGPMPRSNPPIQPQAPKPPPSKPAEAPKPADPAPAADPSKPEPNAPANPKGTGAGTAPAAAPSAVKPTPPAPQKDPEWGPYLTRSNQKDWALTTMVRLDSDSPDMKQHVYDPQTKRSGDVPIIRPFEFETASMVFPMVAESAGSKTDPSRIRGTVKFNDRVVGDSFEIMKGAYHAGTKLMRFDTSGEKNKDGKVVAREVSLEVRIETSCYRVAMDDLKAAQVPWPKGAWPQEAQLSLAPQLYVEQGIDQSGRVQPFEDALVTSTLKRYLEQEGIRDAKEANPLQVARAITRGVWANVQFSGDGLSYRARTSELSNIELRSPQQVLEDGKATEHEGSVLMAALFRKAGLPVRTVIGFDVNDQGSNKFLKNVKKEKKLRSWIEFYLYDEAKNTYNWIPIDVVRLRRGSSRPPAGVAAERPIKFFGSNSELDEVVPFAFHFHPPTDVASYSGPAFFGWFVTPKPPENALQALTFRAEVAPRRGGEPKEAEKKTESESEKEKDKEKKERGAAKKKLGGG